MDKLLEIYETSKINDIEYGEQLEKIIYGKDDNLLKFISSEGTEKVINFNPTLNSGYIDLGIVKIQYGTVNVTTNTNGAVSSNFPFSRAFESDIKVFLVTQFSGNGIVRVKGGNISLSHFSVSVDGGTSESEYKLNWLAIGV